jgi:dihydroneopterin aldolase
LPVVSSDRIELRGLRLLVRCGVLPHEQSQDQPVEVDLDLVLDLSRAAQSDNLADTVDYGAVCTAAEQAASEQQFALLERLADAIADAALSMDGRIDAVDVAVRKLRPPVPQQLETSGVRLTRTRARDTK